MRFYDAFCGIGGFHDGIKQAHPDWECSGACDNNKHARSVYKRHFDGVNIDEDIRELERLPAGTDILCAGFPCQDVSFAGKRAGLGGARTGLFYEVVRLAEASHPRHLFLENVKGLLSSKEGWDFGAVLLALDEIGYDAQWAVLNTADVLPQNRERTFIVATLGGGSPPQIFPIGEDGAIPDEERAKSRAEALHALTATDYKGVSLQRPNCIAVGSEGIELKDGNKKGYSIAMEGDGINLAFAGNRENGRGRVLKGRRPALQTSCAVGIVVRETAPTLTAGAHSAGLHSGTFAIPVLTPDRHEKRQNGRRMKTDGEPMFTLNTQDRHGVALRDEKQKFRIRRLTPTECEKLQGFEVGWTALYDDGREVSDSQRYRMLGNAVSVPVIRKIAERIITMPGD